jgi:hypothetical protein
LRQKTRAVEYAYRFFHRCHLVETRLNRLRPQCLSVNNLNRLSDL